MKKLVLLGCGFVGVRTARLFAGAGWDVTGVTRSVDSAARLAGEPFRVLAFDIADATSLSAAAELQNADALISAVSSGRGGEEAYREVYLRGLQNAIACLNPGRVLFVSSTSVYAQNDGSWVTEESPGQRGLDWCGPIVLLLPGHTVRWSGRHERYLPLETG
jgi:nucleoside-diphosphate-sugar epimerase